MGNHWPAVFSSARACSAALSAFNRSSTVCSNLRSSSIIWQNAHIHAYKWDAAQKKNKTKLVQFIFVLWTILQKKDLLLEKGRKKAWWTQHAINYTRLLLLKIQAWQNQVQNIMTEAFHGLGTCWCKNFNIGVVSCSVTRRIVSCFLSPTCLCKPSLWSVNSKP